MAIQLVLKPSLDDDIKQESIRILREALEEAERGEVKAVLIVLQRPGGHWSDRRSGTMDFPNAIGRLEIVKQAWIESYLKE